MSTFSYSFDVMPLPGPPLLKESPPPRRVDSTARGTRSFDDWLAPAKLSAMWHKPSPPIDARASPPVQLEGAGAEAEPFRPPNMPAAASTKDAWSTPLAATVMEEGADAAEMWREKSWGDREEMAAEPGLELRPRPRPPKPEEWAHSLGGKLLGVWGFVVGEVVRGLGFCGG